jgi:hypothetical protein
LDGEVREHFERTLNALLPWLGGLGERHHSTLALDLALDAHAWMIGLAVMLQRLDLVLALFGALGRTLAHVNAGDLPIAADLAEVYAQLAMSHK